MTSATQKDHLMLQLALHTLMAGILHHESWQWCSGVPFKVNSTYRLQHATQRADSIFCMSSGIGYKAGSSSWGLTSDGLQGHEELLQEHHGLGLRELLRRLD